jgi:hypothetical protein
MSDNLFDFEEVVMDVSTSLGVASTPSPASVDDQPLGTLYESSPVFVASEVTGGAEQ